MDIDLTDKQILIEEQMFTDSKKRLADDNRKTAGRQAWSESKLGIAFTKSASSAFTHAVKDQLTKAQTSAGRRFISFDLLKATGLEPETIAFLFTKAVYNALPLAHRKRIKRVSMCIRAADLIHDEWRMRFFASADNRKALLRKLFKTFDKRTYPREWRKRTILNYFHAEQLDWQGWSQRDKLAVGYALLLLFRDSTGLVVAPKDSKFVDPSPALVEEYEKAVATRPLDFMLYKPMVVPPRPWTEAHLFRGGYLSTKLTRRYPIIKGARKRDILRMTSMDWSQVLPAINAIQETAWRINTKVLDVIEWLMFEKGGGRAGLPNADPTELPPSPEGYGVDERITKEHNHKCFLIHSANREEISKRLSVLSVIAISRQFRNFKQIYFPHNLDTRGRAYPLPAFLNPQGPDYVKSLLEFSAGKPIENEEQAAWLAIAGANAYGKDKIGLQERVDWVQDNDELIFSVARNPYNDLRWMEASEPFQFLRFAFEWTAFWNTGFGYISHMVCPVDATCSGLQHYSAMLRDEVGGRSVNLVPNLPRQDIYQDVADVVIEELMDAAQKFDHPQNSFAMGWIKFGIDRKITKRQVMVVPYAGTFSSCMEYTRDAVMEKLKEGHLCPWNTNDDSEHQQRIVYLSKLIWTAIDKVVVKGKEAMRWLTEVARAYTKEANKKQGTAHSKRMTWVTPDGFEAIHFRAEDKKHHLNTFLDGRIRLTYYEETSKLDGKDMALAIAPNFVHSMDACLLRMAVVKGLTLGITDYGMVHDSFGVHASEMPAFLMRAVKPSFIQMYKRDVLKDFADRYEGIEIPPIPEFGQLDLHQVIDSDFFFS